MTKLEKEAFSSFMDKHFEKPGQELLVVTPNDWKKIATNTKLVSRNEKTNDDKKKNEKAIQSELLSKIKDKQSVKTFFLSPCCFLSCYYFS